jgi:NADH-quinone oxidoreductase subunit N
MNSVELLALLPLLILAGGSILVLLSGAVKTGWYLYPLAGAVIAAALFCSLLVPVTAVTSGVAVTAAFRWGGAALDGAGLVALLLAAGYNRRRGIGGEEYPATLLFALVGMGVVCAATNLLMLFLGLEAFTFAFYILVAAERHSARGGEAGLKYLLNGTLAAALLAMGCALLYVARGTLVLAELAVGGGAGAEPLFLAGGVLLLLGMAFKLSLVPAHLWTADVYQGAPAPVTALLSTASKGASLVALLILLPLFTAWRSLHDILWLLALASLLAGNFAALVQDNLKRMLAWSSVGQMGYVALALVAAPAGGIRGAMFYMVAYGAAGLAAFGALAVCSDTAEPERIDDWRGMGYRRPLPAAVLAVALFSLAGIPPAAGFMAKFGVFAAALKSGEVVLALAGILAALVAVFFYLRVVVVMYMKTAAPADDSRSQVAFSEAVALLVPLLIILWCGLYPQPLLELLGALFP